MEIIHTEKPHITTSLRNLKPTECCYIKQASVESSRAELWIVVFISPLAEVSIYRNCTVTLN